MLVRSRLYLITRLMSLRLFLQKLLSGSVIFVIVLLLSLLCYHLLLVSSCAFDILTFRSDLLIVVIFEVGHVGFECDGSLRLVPLVLEDAILHTTVEQAIYHAICGAVGLRYISLEGRILRGAHHRIALGFQVILLTRQLLLYRRLSVS